MRFRAAGSLFAMWARAWLTAGAAFLVARAWYHDDACTIAHLKCQVANAALAVAYLGGVIGVVALVAAVLALLADALRAKRRFD